MVSIAQQTSPTVGKTTVPFGSPKYRLDVNSRQHASRALNDAATTATIASGPGEFTERRNNRQVSPFQALAWHTQSVPRASDTKRPTML